MAENVTCGICGDERPIEARFCPQCGASPDDAEPAVRRIEITLDDGPTTIVRLNDGELSIGRDPDNDVEIDMAEVSRFHARIMLYEGGYGVMDIGSTNGTFINGKKIAPRMIVRLSHGDAIRIGDNFGAAANITFLDKDNPFTISGRLPIGESRLGDVERYSIGRDPASDLPLDSPVVSWKHAEVVSSDLGYHLNDLGSTNGTFINGRLIRQSLLQPGDEVQIGPFKLVYGDAGFKNYSSVGNVRLDGVQLFKEVSTPQGPRVLLNNISLTIKPREFVALVGGSGAGKTTLMDALNGCRRVQSGQVLVNGDDLYQNFDLYRTNLGYVPQDDIIHTGLPVDRALRYTAMLRLPPDTGKATIEQRVDEVLQQVEMSQQKSQQIKSLSGGQRKRVSIAAELLSEPSLFFLDEPTSGLDPGLDRKMMNTLNELTESGRTIVLTTHATGNIEKCNHVAFMAHGRMVYYGPPKMAPAFFEVDDFTRIYDKLETPERAKWWEGKYRASNAYRHLVAANQSLAAKTAAPAPAVPHGAGPASFDWSANLRQFGILSKRFIDLIINDKLSMFILLAVMPIIGFLLLLIANGNSLIGDSPARINEILASQGAYHIVGDAQKLLLMLALSVILLGLFAASYEIIKEKPVYQRERMVNLGIVPYLASKVTVLMGFGMIQCLALLIVIRLKVPFPNTGILTSAPIELYISLVVALLAGISIGLLISAAVKSTNMVIYLVLVVLIIQIIFSGAFFELPAAARPLSVLTTTRWAIEGLGSTVDMNSLNKLSKQSIVDKSNPASKETVDAAAKFDINYDKTGGHLFQTWTIQVLFSALFLSLTAWLLKRQDV